MLKEVAVLIAALSVLIEADFIFSDSGSNNNNNNNDNQNDDLTHGDGNSNNSNNNNKKEVLVSDLLGLNTTGLQACPSYGSTCQVGGVAGRCGYLTTDCKKLYKRVKKSGLLKVSQSNKHECL